MEHLSDRGIVKGPLPRVSQACRPFAVLSVLVWLVLSASFLTPARATPMTWGDDVKTPIRWEKGSTIRVYVQKDPDGKGRDQLAKEGLDRWKQKLADRGITLEVEIGDPPADAKNAVPVTWEDDGTEMVGLKLGPRPDNDGLASCTSDGKKIVGGEVYLRKALPAETDAEKDFIRNLAEHELTHVLGLADDEKGAVTNHTQPSSARTWNDQDTKELNALYGTAASEGEKKAKGNFEHTGGGPDAGVFQYAVFFEPGNEIPDPLDPEHVPLILIGVDPGLVQEVIPPPGWVVYRPMADGPEHPYFREGYMVDGVTVPAPWGPARPARYIALRVSHSEATRDGLPPEIDPALSLDTPINPIILLTVPGVRNGIIPVCANGEIQMVPGPIASGQPPFTLGDVGIALRVWAGLAPADPTILDRLDVVSDGDGPGIDLRDAARIARKAAGLEPNP